jgi:hypothetical protein
MGQNVRQLGTWQGLETMRNNIGNTIMNMFENSISSINYQSCLYGRSCYVVYNCWFCNKGLDLVPRHLCGQFITMTILTSISSNFIHVLCFICYLYGYVYIPCCLCVCSIQPNFMHVNFSHMIQFHPYEKV